MQRPQRVVLGKSEEGGRRPEIQGTFSKSRKVDVMVSSVQCFPRKCFSNCKNYNLVIAILLAFLMSACESKFNHENLNQFKVSYIIIVQF